MAATPPRPPLTSPPSIPSPTRVRFVVIGLSIAMSLLLYLDRFAITPATSVMLAELTLTKEQFGDAVGAFFLAYALMQIPSGWLTDALGARWMLALYVVSWSIATIGLGLAQGLMAIWLMRLVLGVAQAGAYPAAAALLKRWVPYSARGVANSSVSMGGRMGLLISLMLTVPLMMWIRSALGWETDAWRAVFVIYGALGLGWGAAFLWMYRDWPRKHPWCNAAEVALIEGNSPDAKADAERPAADWIVGTLCTAYFVVNIGWILLVGNSPTLAIHLFGRPLTAVLGSQFQASALLNLGCNLIGLVGTLALAAAINAAMRQTGSPAATRMKLPLADMAASKEMWLMCGINFLVNVGWIFLATWLPQYLIENYGSQLTGMFHASTWLGRSLAAMHPQLTGWLSDESLIAALIAAIVGVAAIGGGLAGGRATDVFVRRFGRAWGRRLPGLCAGLLVCGMYLVVPQLSGLGVVVCAMIAIAFTIDFGLGATWASYQDIGGRHVASVLGCGNMCGNLGAAFFGKQIGALADHDQWNAVFYISAGAMALAACCWLMFDASRPISREDSRAGS
jgi:MFS family permease